MVVVDMTQNVAGPYAAMVLADLGANVTKLEPPAGDPTTTWGPPFWNGHSATYLALNRNKRRETVDVKLEEGRRRVFNLLEDADVLLVSNRPAALQRAGLDYERLHELFPRLIYAEITAFGHHGPRRSDPGYDPLMQAMGGIMSVTGHPGDEPVRVGTSIVDMGTGMWVAMGVMAALRMRERTGRGHRVTGALFETAVAWMTYHITSYWASGDVPHGWGSGTAMIAPYEAFPALDGWIVMAAGNDKLFEQLCRVLGRGDWIDSPEYRTNADRVRNRARLREEISQITRQATVAEWEVRLREAGIPGAPVADVAEVLQNPQLLSGDLIQAMGTASIPNFRSVGLPLTFDGRRPPLRTPPPGLDTSS
ncbi:CaiB/BaiF CoA-transferase family protein [Alicyclobacillus macrosporangiidus]|uniref:CaiB/BaiF CoA transferase family protein n=1 Tax=Alicyclobacillus macrosporangiidus TaxID=392015 RepID=UPI0026F024E9|nr:CoA transferase [Alicyclobacillus macrosporangiidus]